jgi:hypothetical protein
MFRSSTILREIVQSLAKVTLLLKHSVKLRPCMCGIVAACREMACVLFVMQSAGYAKLCKGRHIEELWRGTPLEKQTMMRQDKITM